MQATALAFDQVAIVGLLAAMFVAFATERFRTELVAIAGVAVAFLLGLVPAGDIFSGYSSSAVVTVVEVLIIVQVLGRSRVLDPATRFILRFAHSDMAVIAALSALAASVSVFMNNIGALALVLPMVFQVAASTGMSQRKLLLPVSYATLLGGTCSLIGTPANLIVSAANRDITGEPLGFFDFAYAGVPATIMGLVILVLWVPRVLGEARDDAPAGEYGGRRILSEFRICDGSEWTGRRLTDIESDFGLSLHTVVRDGRYLFARRSDIVLLSGDVVLINGELGRIAKMIDTGALAYADRDHDDGTPLLEAVVMPESTLVGSSIQTLEVFRARGISVVGIATQSARIEGRLVDQRISIGDILYLRGDQRDVAAALREAESLQLWPSAERWKAPPSLLSLGVFALGVLLAALELVPTEMAFGLVILVLLAMRQLNLRAALADINWPIIIMLASMMPLAAAVETTGAAASIARWLASVMPSDAPVAAVGLMLASAFLLTPFINNASSALVLVPVAVEMARHFNCPVEALLFAVAIGVSVDFLTPFGHHNNTIAMGIAGYRFSDFPRAGWPVSCAVLLVAFFAITVVWL